VLPSDLERAVGPQTKLQTVRRQTAALQHLGQLALLARSLLVHQQWASFFSDRVLDFGCGLEMLVDRLPHLNVNQAFFRARQVDILRSLGLLNMLIVGRDIIRQHTQIKGWDFHPSFGRVCNFNIDKFVGILSVKTEFVV
jgi:hypothetical protein